jgi:Pyruvate:ferredoxin oxidoreductase and related 2-oxoacid:ferredoxin oxidoreductases, gamma subunit
MINCLIAGVGGQGTVLASKLIAVAAMEKGLAVRTTETIGMAQRGGSVVSHVRMGDIIHAPLIPIGEADLIIAFEPAEAVRVLPYLKKGGHVIVCDSPIQPAAGGNYDVQGMLAYLKDTAANTAIINGEGLFSKCEAKALNVALLGAALECGVLPFDRASFVNTIRNGVPERFLTMNLNAFDVGGKMYHEAT